MIIKKIEIINFGKIKNLKIDLNDNMNLFYGENEAGKSTIVTFLRAMFYGFKNKKHREKIFPWNGAMPRGELVVELDDKEFLISRTFKESNSKDLIEVRDNFTFTRELRYNYKNLGELFIGISENTFEKTLWVTQTDSSIIKGSEDEITSKLSNLASTGDENVSFDKALTNINKKIKDINGKKGKYNQVVEKKKELIKRIERIKEVEELYKEHEAKLQELKEESLNLKFNYDEAFNSDENEIENLKEKVESLKKYKELDENYLEKIIKLQNQNENIHKEISSFKDEEEKLKELERNLEKARANLGDLIVFENITIEEEKNLYNLSKEADKENFLSENNNRKRQIESKIKNIDIKKYRYLFYFSLFMSIISLSITIFKFNGILIALTVILICLSVGAYFIYQNNYKEIRELRKDIRKLSVSEDSEYENKNFDLSFKLKEYNLQSYDEFVNKINLFKIKRLDLEMYKEKYNDKLKYIESLGYTELLNKREEIKVKLYEVLSYFGVNSTKEIIENYQSFHETTREYNERVLKNSRKQIEQKSERYLQNEKEILKIENKLKEFLELKEEKLEILEKISENKREESELEFKLKALMLSKESIEKGFYELQKEFAPILNKKVEDIVKKITNNKYKRAKVDKDLGITIEDDKTHAKKEIDNFSFGTIHQVYLALRLGIIELIMEEKTPIILDEAFSQYDDERLKEILTYIEKDKNQYLIFTCQKREKIIIDNNNIECNYIHLS